MDVAASEGGSTRCGVATTIDEAVLAAAQERLGEISLVRKTSDLDRKTEHGDYSNRHALPLPLIDSIP